LTEVGQAFIGTVQTVVPADAFGMYRLAADSAAPVDVFAEADAGLLDAYEAYGRADDPVLKLVLRDRLPIDSSRACRTEEWEQSGARTVLGKSNLDHSLEAPLIVSGKVVGTINFARSGRHAAFTDDDLSAAQFAAEQLGMAIDRALRFEQADLYSSMLERVLDRLPHGVILTDLDARVIFKNRLARSKTMVDVTEDGPLPNAVANSVAGAMERFRDGARVHTTDVKDPVSHSHVVVKSFALGHRHNVAVTMVYDCGDAENARQLPAWNLLTSREQEIAQLVSEGLTTRQIAERAFITENTVKQHLKRVFAKTDVRSRAELVQAIWASADGATVPVSA